VASEKLTFSLAITVMFVIGVLVGYFLGGSKVVTVITTTPSSIPTSTPSPTAVTTAKTETSNRRVTTTTVATYTPTPKAVTLGDWRISVVDVKEAKYIKTLVSGNWKYYEAPEGRKIVVITLRVENTGTDVRNPFLRGLNTPLLVTDANITYHKVYTDQLGSIYELAKEIEQTAVECNYLDTSSAVAPGASIKGDFMYLIPAAEKPAQIVITYQPPLPEPEATAIIRLG